MPRIPTYQRQGTVSGQGPNAGGSFGGQAIPNALAGAATAIGDLGNTLLKRQQEMKKEEQYLSTQRIGALVNKDVQQFTTDSLNRKETDAFNSMEWVDEWEKSTLDKYTKDITDERQKADIANHVLAQTIHVKNRLATHEAEQRKVVANNTRALSLETDSQTAYAGDMPLDVIIKRSRQALLNDPTLGETERINKTMAADSVIADSYLDGVVNRNPAAAIEMIKSGIFNNYLDKAKTEAHDKKANDLMKYAERDAKAAETEALRQQKEALEIKRQQVNKDLTDMEVGGKLNRQTVAKFKDVLNENEYRQWFDRIEAREERIKKAAKGEGSTGEFKTDKALDAKFYRRLVLDPESVSEAEILDSIGAGLSRTSAKALIDERSKRIKGEIDPAFAAGERAVIENLKRDRKAGLFGEGRTGDAEYAKQTEALKRWMKAHPKDDPSEYYEKLTEPNKTGFVASVLDTVLMGFYDPKEPDVKKRREELSGEKKTLTIGTVQKGYEYKGGDPSKQSSWVKVKK